MSLQIDEAASFDLAVEAVRQAQEGSTAIFNHIQTNTAIINLPEEEYTPVDYSTQLANPYGTARFQPEPEAPADPYVEAYPQYYPTMESYTHATNVSPNPDVIVLQIPTAYGYITVKIFIFQPPQERRVYEFY